MDTRLPWYEDEAYDHLIGVSTLVGITYERYDALVHVGWTDAAARLRHRAKAGCGPTPAAIVAEYDGRLREAAKIDGAAECTAYARQHGLGPLRKAARKVARAEELQAEALALLAVDGL